MRRFLAGLLLGLASMYWYAYQRDATFAVLQDWFAYASHDADAPAKVNKLFSSKR